LIGRAKEFLYEFRVARVWERRVVGPPVAVVVVSRSR
jgi:hypothetical protein